MQSINSNITDIVASDMPPSVLSLSKEAHVCVWGVVVAAIVRTIVRTVRILSIFIMPDFI